MNGTELRSLSFAHNVADSFKGAKNADLPLTAEMTARSHDQTLPRARNYARVLLSGLLGRYKTAQERNAELSNQLTRRHREALPDDERIDVALAKSRFRAHPISQPSEAGGLYFIGGELRRDGDSNAHSSPSLALRAHPAHAKAWIRLGRPRLQAKY